MLSNPLTPLASVALGALLWSQIWIAPDPTPRAPLTQVLAYNPTIQWTHVTSDCPEYSEFQLPSRKDISEYGPLQGTPKCDPQHTAYYYWLCRLLDQETYDDGYVTGNQIVYPEFVTLEIALGGSATYGDAASGGDYLINGATPIPGSANLWSLQLINSPTVSAGFVTIDVQDDDLVEGQEDIFLTIVRAYGSAGTKINIGWNNTSRWVLHDND